MIKNYKTTDRTYFSPLSKSYLKVNPCPYCGKVPKAFEEGRFVRDKYKRWKWVYDGIYVVIQCEHPHKTIQVERKVGRSIARTLLTAICDWNNIT